MKSKIILITFLILNYLYVYSQTCQKKENTTSRKHYDLVLDKYYHDYHNATTMLFKAIELEPMFVDAYFLLGVINYEKAIEYQKIRENPKAYFDKSVENLNKSIEICEEHADYLAYFYLAQINNYYKEFELAKKNYQYFLNKNNTNTQEVITAKDNLEYVNKYFAIINNPVKFEPVLLENVSSYHDDFMPLLSADEQTMYYTRRYYRNNNRKSKNFVEELTCSQRVVNDSLYNNYLEGKPLPSPFNEGQTQGAITMTIDNKTMFITICNIESTTFSSITNCDIYFTKKRNKTKRSKDEWQALKPVPNINTTYAFDGQPSITTNGKTIYFASNRRGGYGGYDIYKTEKTRGGTWSQPINLGESINTSGDEKTPFIHSDNKTIYFSSNGRIGVGGFDIYVSQKIDATWAEPMNIGYPINSEAHEVAYSVSTNGKQMFFSAYTNDETGWDIYSSELPEHAKPSKVLFLKGKITNSNGNPPANTTVELTNLTSMETTEWYIDDKSGKYAVSTSVEQDDEFMLTIQSEGNLFCNYYIDPFLKEFEPPTEIDIELDEIKTNTPIELKNVTFATNSAEINDKTKIVLGLLISFLKNNPEMKIEIHGHTDNIGSKKDNLTLSQNRIESVKSFLVENEINSKRVKTKAFGESQPKTTNSTEEGRSRNRRVEFIIK